MVTVHEYSIRPTATGEEAEQSRAGCTDHEYSCIHEPIGQHTVVPFKQALVEQSLEMDTVVWIMSYVCVHLPFSNYRSLQSA